MINLKIVCPDQDGRFYKVEAKESQLHVERLVIPHFSEGIAFDGAAILKDGEAMTIEDIVDHLNTYADALAHCKKEFEWARSVRGGDGFLKTCVAKVDSALEG